MDANRQRFWTLADPADWPPSARDAGIVYDARCRRLRLRGRRPPLPGTPDTAAADLLLTAPSRAVDAGGALAFWDPAARGVYVAGAANSGGAVAIYTPPAGVNVIDLALGFDDVLYLSLRESGAGGANRIGLFDPRGRWRQPRVFTVDLGDFRADRLAADPAGGVRVLDRVGRRLGRVRGMPSRDGFPPEFSPTVFRPDPENPDPPRFDPDPRPVPWDAAERPVALACHPEGRLAVLAWDAGGETGLYVCEPDGAWSDRRRLAGAGMPGTAAWYAGNQLAVLPSPRFVQGISTLPREALLYDTDEDTTDLQPSGEYLPTPRLQEPLFLKGTMQPPRYPVAADRHAALLPLSFASLAGDSAARSRPLDSGREGTVWHRVCLEGVFPPGCGAILELAATDDPHAAPASLEWFPHLFGETPPETGGTPARGVWVRDASEIPHHPGLLGRAPERDRAGLFTVLIQHPGRRVRRLAGRHLHARVRLFGAGHSTPEIAAVRLYGSRFSYRDAYLAEVYQEELFGEDADAAGPATGPDFLERFLCLFESVLTPMEDRVAAAQVLMDAWSAPEDALEWLGSWIGVTFDPAFSPARQRAWIAAASRLFRARGTLAGLQLALEIATGGRVRRTVEGGREGEAPSGGGVTGGEIVVIEDFRLRRTFATILGADLSLPDDPLLPGLIVSANSRVGDTLFLGDAEKVELLSLFRDAFSADPTKRAEEMAAERAFYARLAHRVTVFVHDQVTPVDFRLLERITEREAPAHLAIRVVRATYPLLVGLASLVDVDTYLLPRRRFRPARANHTRLGEGDFILGGGGLDPRANAPGPGALPVARIAGPATVVPGADFTLDASGSTASPGAGIARYIWVRQPDA